MIISLGKYERVQHAELLQLSPTEILTILFRS